MKMSQSVAIAAVQLLGKAHTSTRITGSMSVETANVVDVAELAAMLHQPLGLQLDSMSVVTIGSRRPDTGDYPRVYDSFIGTPPYAGRRETWLIMRLAVIDNTAALRWRTTLGSASVAAAQRIAATLRCTGMRTKVATASDLVELDRRLGVKGLEASAQRWNNLRGENGWLTTYAYPAEAIASEVLAEAWALRVDEVIQNVTVYPNGTCTATVTVRTPQPLPTPPSVALRRLPGEQAAAAAANMCGPRPRVRGLRPSPLPASLLTEVGPSGVLLGRLSNGDRLLTPLTDVGELSRVFIAADDPIAKRLIIRTSGAGERVCVHTRDRARWASVRMPDVAVVSEPRPAPRTTVSVVDGVPRMVPSADGTRRTVAIDTPLAPSPRPGTVITVVPAGTPPPERDSSEVIIEQVNRSVVRVTAAGDPQPYLVEMDMFRAENRYVSQEPLAVSMAQ